MKRKYEIRKSVFPVLKAVTKTKGDEKKKCQKEQAVAQAGAGLQRSLLNIGTRRETTFSCWSLPNMLPEPSLYSQNNSSQLATGR